MKNFISNLEQTALFRGIEVGSVEQLLHCIGSQQKNFEKNNYVLMAELDAPFIGLILSGSMHVLKEDFWGNRAILTQLGSGDLFAEAFVCAQWERMPVNVMAVEKSEVLFLDYHKILTICSPACKYHLQLIKNMLQVLAEKNIMLTQKMEHLMQRTTREKMISFLSAQAQQAGSNDFQIPFNRQALADYLAVDRSALSNELSKMQEEGLLEFEKNHFILQMKGERK